MFLAKVVFVTVQKHQYVREVQKDKLTEFSFQHVMFRAVHGGAGLGVEICCWKSCECCCTAEFRK